MDAPVIFIHYGDSYYLKYTLESAVLFNPGKKVILLGDESNVHYTRLGLEHYHFKDYDSGTEIADFDRVYLFVAGPQHSRREWTRFVFRRWFHIYYFILAKGYQRFWTFDSDTLILTDLVLQEEKYKDYDCTEQCSGICMNGLVNNQAVVKGYLEKINELFQRPAFLKAEKANFRIYRKYAFTEMKAYVMYREEAGIKRIRLSTIFNGESYLDSICTTEEHRRFFQEDEYEIYLEKVWGLDLKKIFLCTDGNIYFWHKSSNRPVLMNTINMSWTPFWLLDALLQHAKRKLQSEFYPKNPYPTMSVLDLRVICTQKNDLSMNKEKKTGSSKNQSADRLQDPGRDRNNMPKLPLMERLKEKLKKIRKQDPNNYPLW